MYPKEVTDIQVSYVHTDAGIYSWTSNQLLMSSSPGEALKREAINAILTRLGEGMFVMLKLALIQNFKINIDNYESYTLEELHMALQRIVGPYGSSLLMREIRNEARLLREEKPAGVAET